MTLTATATAAPYELADLFCGAGGTTAGAYIAAERGGYDIEMSAVNHSPIAIETHSANHPAARHFVEDLANADPERIVPRGHLDLLIASPECRYYSRARGGKPINDQGRMNPWIVQRWITSLSVDRILVENVPEFADWGPLGPNRKPDPTRKGLYFREWTHSLRRLGMNVEYRFLNAADFGDATSRVRFFLQGRSDGQPITWPKPTHTRDNSEPGYQDLLPWRGAAEIIDWNLPGRSLLDHPKYRRKPLSDKTRWRIAKGLQRYGGPLAPLFIDLLEVPNFPKMPAKNAASPHEPFIVANRSGNAARSFDHPIPPATTTTGGGSFLVHPEMRPFTLGQQSCAAPRQHHQPIATISAAGAISLIEPVIVQYIGQNAARPMHNPLSTILSMRKHAFVEPCLTTDIPQDVDPRRIVDINGVLYLLDIRFRMLQNSELARAMSFEDEQRSYRFSGNVTQVARQIGNAVPVRTAAALVEAALT